MSSFEWPRKGSGGGGTGTVTSVALTVPSFLMVTGSPITTSGTFDVALQTEAANTVFAGPATGADAEPTFRSLVTADLPFIIGDLSAVGVDGISVTGGTGAVIGSGTSIAQQAADATHNGYLTSTDWSIFDGKQDPGNYITALTGDGTAIGPGSAVLTLATVNGNVGTFGSSTSIPTFTVNAKGLITAASGNVVIAPAGTLTGTTLNATVVSSSLTSVGTLITGIWNAIPIAIAYGGTGQTTKAPAFDALSPMTTGGDLIYGGASGTGTRLPNGTAGQILTSAGGTLAPSWQSPSSGITSFTLTNNQASFIDITGFLVDPTLHSAFVAETSTVRYHTDTLSITDVEDTAFYGNLGTAADSNVTALGYLSDGSIIIGGAFTNFNGVPNSGIAKVAADGTIDGTFTTNVGTGFTTGVNVLAIAVQADDKILVGGSFSVFNGNSRNFLVRLNSDGTEDTAFYGNLGTSFSSQVESIYVQANQKILVGGLFSAFNGNARNFIVRLNSDGTEDTAFYGNLGTAADSTVQSFFEQADTTLLVGGAFSDFNGNGVGGLVKLSAAGIEDTAFSANLGTGFDSSVFSIETDPDNSDRILIGGAFSLLNGVSRDLLVLLNSDGTDNTAFYTNLGTSFNNQVNRAKIQQGKYVIAGSFNTLNGNLRKYTVRLNADGTEDTAFYTSLGSSFNDLVHDLLVQPNLQLIYGGNFTNFAGNTRNHIIRYEQTTLTPNDYVSQDTIKGVFHESTGVWTLSDSSSLGDATGLSLQMTDLGQLQYKTTDIPGSIIEEVFKFQIVSL